MLEEKVEEEEGEERNTEENRRDESGKWDLGGVGEIRGGEGEGGGTRCRQ